MKLKEFNILLDIKKHNKSEEFEVVQGDYDTNVLNISIVEGLKPYNLDGVNVEIAFAKPDGTTVLQDIDNGITIMDPIGGKIQCVLKTNTIAAPGRVFAEVRILQGLKLLTTAKFSFFVRKAIVNDETIISTNEFPILNQKIEEVNDLIEYVQGMEPIKGDDGKSAYEVWLDAGNEGTVEDFLESLIGPEGPEGKQGVGLDYTWQGTQLGIKREDEIEYSFTDLRGPKGEKGEKGEKGDPGTGINIKGSLNDPSELPSTGDLGDAYLINGNLWVWDGETFVNAGNIKGPKGDPGSDAEVTKENIEAALGYTPVKSVNNVVADEIGNVELDIDTSAIENRIDDLEDNLVAHKAEKATQDKLGHVKAGQNITIDSDGTINAKGGNVDSVNGKTGEVVIDVSDIPGLVSSSLALGLNASAEYSAVALGRDASAMSYSVAIGRDASAGSHDSVALGRDASAMSYSVAIGLHASAGGGFTVALGRGASAENANEGILGGAASNVPSKWIVPGSFTVNGTKNFEIPHPKPEKKATHVIRHGSVESPTPGDTLYRWKIQATKDNDIVTIDLPDYFVWLNKDVQIFVTPQGHFGNGYGELNRETEQLEIHCQFEGEYNVLVIGTRNDNHPSVQEWSIKGVEREIGESWTGETYAFSVDEIIEIEEIKEVGA